MAIHETKYEKGADGKIRKAKKDGKTSKAASEKNQGADNTSAGNTGK